MSNLKKMKGITENLKNFLNIDVDHIQSKDIEKILKLPLPIHQIDNLIKITEHTNESLQLSKDSLIKNRNLIAEEISCLNEVFVNCHCSVDSIEHAAQSASEDESEFVKDRGNSDSEFESYEKQESEDKSPRKQSHADYEAKKILLQIKNNRSESLGSPPRMLDLTKFN